MNLRETLEAIKRRRVEEYQRQQNCKHTNGQRVFGVGSFSTLYYCPDCKGYYEDVILPEDDEWINRTMRMRITI